VKKYKAAMNCPLCNEISSHFCDTNKKSYFKCPKCKGIFIGNDFLPDYNFEKSRYSEHNNDINDTRYQNFVSPIVNAILKDYNKNNIGLDFGAGTGPVISKMLNDNDYKIFQYDPFFYNNKDLLQNKYDYIACCEVIEHFHKPEKEFTLLKNIMNKNAKLYCMTKLYSKDIDFNLWYYKNDPTHVFFYQIETLKFIACKYNFSDLYINNSLIIFTN